jgi:hypothetical protein
LLGLAGKHPGVDGEDDLERTRFVPAGGRLHFVEFRGLGGLQNFGPKVQRPTNIRNLLGVALLHNHEFAGADICLEVMHLTTPFKGHPNSTFLSRTVHLWNREPCLVHDPPPPDPSGSVFTSVAAR